MRYRIAPAAWLILALVLVPSAARAQQRAGLPADKLEKIEKAITERMSREGIPGLSVAVVVEGKLRWSNGYGLADVENFVPSKALTAYRLELPIDLVNRSGRTQVTATRESVG